MTVGDPGLGTKVGTWGDIETMDVSRIRPIGLAAMVAHQVLVLVRNGRDAPVYTVSLDSARLCFRMTI